MRHSRLAPSTIISIFLTACGSGEVATAGITVIDSAGVELVRHSQAAIEDAPALVPVEVVRIGTVDGPEDTRFFRLAGAVEIDNEIYTLDYGDHRVRVFGMDGQLRRAFGREGGGPGEFRRPQLLQVMGDTVVVQGQRLNLLNRQGEPLATGPGRVLREGGYLLWPILTTAGWMGAWYSRGAESARPGRSYRDTVTIVHTDPLTGELGDPVLQYLQPETRLAGEIGFMLTPFFQARPSYTIGPDGRVYLTMGETYAIEIVNPAGRLERRIEGDFTARAVTGAMVDDAMAEERARYKDAPPGSESAMYAKVMDQRAALPVPETLPVFGRMWVSTDGRLLAQRLDLDPDPVRSGDPSTWDLFDAAGHLKGRLTLDAKTVVLGLTADGFLANVRDEMDIQYLVKYRLVASSEPSS